MAELWGARLARRWQLPGSGEPIPPGVIHGWDGSRRGGACERRVGLLDAVAAAMRAADAVAAASHDDQFPSDVFQTDPERRRT